MQHVDLNGLTLGNDRALTLIAGPCQLESADHAQMIAGTLQETCRALGAGLVFKGSFDKANRTSLSGRRGLGWIGASRCCNRCATPSACRC